VLSRVAAQVSKAIQHAQEALADKNLSDAGQRRNYTENILAMVADLNGQQATLRDALAKVQREKHTLRQSTSPRPASREEREALYELARMSRESPANMAFAMSVFAKADQTPEELSLSLALCSVSPMIFGPNGAALASEYQNLVRTRLHHALWADKGETLDERQEEIEAEMVVIVETRRAIVQSADRPFLVELKLIPKPVSLWSADERLAHVREHGPESLAELLLIEGSGLLSESLESAFVATMTPAPVAAQPAAAGVP